jgi:hypothetical protein
MEARKEVIRCLAAGDLTLFEAAARFRLLNNIPAELADRGWHLFEGRCEGEKVCRQVLLWAEAELKSVEARSRAGALLRNLEAELAAHIARNGRVVLPDLVADEHRSGRLAEMPAPR